MVDENIKIPLHRDVGLSIGQVVGWAVGANLLVFSLAAIAFGLIPWWSGEELAVTPTVVAITGLSAFFVTFGMLVFARRRHARSRARTGDAALLFGEEMVVRTAAGEVLACGRADDVRVRPAHALDVEAGQEYYVGPAVTFGFGEVEVTVASLDGSMRWTMDPPSTRTIDWICTAESWRRLLETLEMEDEIVKR